MKRLVVIVFLALLLLGYLGLALAIKRSFMPEIVSQEIYDYNQEKPITGYLDNIRVEGKRKNMFWFVENYIQD